jgi:hypothetical protein
MHLILSINTLERGKDYSRYAYHSMKLIHAIFTPHIQACEACHKSKRRCDGQCKCCGHFLSPSVHHNYPRLIRPLSELVRVPTSRLIITQAQYSFLSDFAGKQCVYKDSAGRMVPPPYPRVPQSTSVSSAHPPIPKNTVNSTQQSSTYIVSSHPNPPGSGVVFPSIQSLSNDPPSLDLTRQSHSNSITWSHDKSTPSPLPIQDLSTMLHDVGLDPHLCRELVNCTDH